MGNKEIKKSSEDNIIEQYEKKGYKRNSIMQALKSTDGSPTKMKYFLE